MTIAEELLKADAKKADELATGTYESKRLARILGKSGTVTIQIKEIPTKRLAEYLDGTQKNGDYNFPKLLEASNKIVLAGVTEPSLKDKDLQEHFGCKLGIDLVEKLFGNEVIEISNAIQSLSGIADVDEDEIKN